MANVLAIDLGTTGIRAVVYDAAGKALASEYQKLGMQVSSQGWISQDPMEMFKTSLELANRVSKKFTGAIESIGIAAQRGTAIAWDKSTGKALSPAISWQDQRTLPRVQELIAMGVPVNTLAACTKFEWLIQEVPEVAAAASSNCLAFGTPDAWLTACFTQQQALVTDCSNAGATGLYDAGQQQWFDMAMELFHQDPAWHMQLVATDADVGTTDLLSCGKGIALSARAGDQQAACFAHNLKVGQAKLTLGTSGMLDVHYGSSAPQEPAGTHALPLWQVGEQAQVFCLEGSVLTAGASIEWAQRIGLLGAVDELADLVWNPEHEVLFVPALAGLGTPYMQREHRACFANLSLSTTREDMLLGIITGLAHRCADLVETLSEKDKPIREIFVDGGLSRSNVLMQAIADFANVKILQAEQAEMTALGVALLAGREFAGRGSASETLQDSPVNDENYTEFSAAISADLRAAQRKKWNAQIDSLG